ncbi:MAG: MBL fold metallo-hydrolase [Firmicutes bacterium]|nr:MBL fold metallo-hydrolase [Candidatus Colivicinus equi]
MEIIKYVLGPLGTNTYLLKQGKDVLLIDPASKAEKLASLLNEYNLLGILLTHGHFDHIKAVDGLYDKYKCPVYLHHDDEELARDKYSGSDFGLVSYISVPTVHIKEGINQIGPFNFEVIYTPGHTEGSVIYVFSEDIFTGDTLFRCGVGRTDLKGGNERKLRDSLRTFTNFTKDYRIHPGHDEESILSYELNYNPYLR